MNEEFTQVLKLNVSDKVESKNGLKYLSWAWAWGEFKKIYPNATYNIKRFENNLPYVYDEKTGYMVFTEVTVGELTYEMWLPVMDNHNKAIKENCTMFEINKTIMRCLTKNLAMFGLGLYIYAGEDLPEIEKVPITKEQIEKFKELDVNELNVCKHFKVGKIEELTQEQAEYVIEQKIKAKGE